MHLHNIHVHIHIQEHRNVHILPIDLNYYKIDLFKEAFIKTDEGVQF